MERSDIDCRRAAAPKGDRRRAGSNQQRASEWLRVIGYWL